MEKIRQMLFVPPAPIVWAHHLGSFEKEGVAVSSEPAASSAQMGHGLARGPWHLGLAVMDNVIAWNAAHAADLQIVAQLERHTEMRFVCPRSDRSMVDVARHPIAVDATDNGFVLALYRALAREGIDWRDCALDPVGGVRHRFESLMQGHARSSILIPPFDLLAAAGPYHTLWSREDVAPAYPGVVVVARRAWLHEQRGAATGYLRALLRAQAWAREPAHREAAVAVLYEAHIPEAVAQRLIDEPVHGLLPSAEGWRETLALRRECGLESPRTPQEDQIIDTALLEQATLSLAEEPETP